MRFVALTASFAAAIAVVFAAAIAEPLATAPHFPGPRVVISSGNPVSGAASLHLQDRDIARGSLWTRDGERTFSYRLPSADGDSSGTAAAGAVIVFHGAGGDGGRIRGFIGAELERHATAAGLAVVYADGLHGHWNDCRALAPYPAKREGVDDIGFVRELVGWLDRHDVDPDRIHALGFSNGGHFAIRLALEIPEQLRAAVAFGASLPVEEEMDCSPSRSLAPIMLVNGTRDPVNPFDGGEAVGLDGARLGRVLPSMEAARYFARRGGIESQEAGRESQAAGRESQAAGRESQAAGRGSQAAGRESQANVPKAERVSGASPVERTEWGAQGVPTVVHIAVSDGGHTIPGRRLHFPDILGRTEPDFEALEHAIRFFRIHGERGEARPSFSR